MDAALMSLELHERGIHVVSTYVPYGTLRWRGRQHQSHQHHQNL
jgi:hypothetical protein